MYVEDTLLSSGPVVMILLRRYIIGRGDHYLQIAGLYPSSLTPKLLRYIFQIIGRINLDDFPYLRRIPHQLLRSCVQHP
jgi:hypothetical protein